MSKVPVLVSTPEVPMIEPPVSCTPANVWLLLLMSKVPPLTDTLLAVLIWLPCNSFAVPPVTVRFPAIACPLPVFRSSSPPFTVVMPV